MVWLMFPWAFRAILMTGLALVSYKAWNIARLSYAPSP